MAAVLVAVPAASASGQWAGSDPSSNFAAGALPASCSGEPDGAACVDAAVSSLDQARASLGQPPYALPADFDSLAGAQQALILTNLDRALYGLPPVPGLAADLDQDAALGVQQDGDPLPSEPGIAGFTSNWAGGFANLPFAYEAWMYDDGPGSGNVDCTAADTSGCWGHRHDILWEFGAGDVLGMGAAAGTDGQGAAGYAMLIVDGWPTAASGYTYTWSQAVADGAGAGTVSRTSASPPAPGCVVPRVKGATLAAAKRAIARAHCRTGRIGKAYSGARKGRIASERPASGRHLAAGARVRLVVSRGSRPHR